MSHDLSEMEIGYLPIVSSGMSKLTLNYCQITRQLMYEMTLNSSRVIRIFMSEVTVNYEWAGHPFNVRNEIELEHRGGRRDLLRKNTRDALRDRPHCALAERFTAKDMSRSINCGCTAKHLCKPVNCDCTAIDFRNVHKLS